MIDQNRQFGPAPANRLSCALRRPSSSSLILCSTVNLGDKVLALATGKTQQEIAAACKGARANHIGAALSRHKRAGRIEERDGKLYAIQSPRTEQQAAL